MQVSFMKKDLRKKKSNASKTFRYSKQTKQKSLAGVRKKKRKEKKINNQPTQAKVYNLS